MGGAPRGSGSKPRPAAEPTRPPEGRPVNPWEARWKAASARLPSAEARPKVARPEPFHATDRYPGVPLREPSVARPRPADLPVPPSPARGFSTEPPAAEAPGYPAPPSVSPPSRLGRDVAARPAASTSPGPRPRPARFDRPAAFEAAPASPFSSPDQESGIAWLSRIRPAPQLDPSISPLERPRPAPSIDPGPGQRPATTDNDPASAEQPAAGNLSALVEAWEFPLVPEEEDRPDPPRDEIEDADAEPASSPAAVAGCCLGYSPLEDRLGGAALPIDCPAEAAEPAVVVPICRDSEIEIEIAPASDEVKTSPTEPAEPGPPPAFDRGLEPPHEEHARNPVRIVEPAHRFTVDTSGYGLDPFEMKTEGARKSSGFDLPSAQEILASAPRRPVQPARGPVRTDWDRATPTQPREPGQWNVPLWLAWPPAALLVLAMGIGGLLLTCRWAGETYDASVVAQHLLARTGAAGKPRPLPESMVPPEPSWWRTTPDHLAQWGVYLGRSASEDDRAEEARRMLEGAVRISPINPTARLAREQLEPEPAEASGPVRALGLSRDAASLAWTARSLRQAGKKAAAIRLYREALRIAGRPDPTTAPEPVFDEDPAVRRYLLPGEAAAAAVVRELFADPARTFQEWSEAVPPDTIARLATARLFREQGRPEAETLIAQVIEEGRGSEGPLPSSASGTPPPPRPMRCSPTGARPRSTIARRSTRWTTPSSSGRGGSTWRASRTALDDETQRQAALQAALDAPSSDDISRRAIEFQRASEPLARPRSGATKAN